MKTLKTILLTALVAGVVLFAIGAGRKVAGYSSETIFTHLVK